ncbi:hypothetical protein BABINDRAFT_150270 [Babjeviella inositovora NRRL Y-12698]|uniref:Uncharacterized protein n=1 Tax=Babjeviella inositovora NRRL Y-12698 TaxID=984486 RepID=A0A1E3QNP2_9ASCO|nr:uncharacterized protein BABINDRAFT_150270 [Babjeviella inositovora NRRL Y-12698]ODQ79260.1 hypothetical protein BABINDRAFT_150270 [Babjeviella inositovora NRRL Y-12698]
MHVTVFLKNAVLGTALDMADTVQEIRNSPSWHSGFDSFRHAFVNIASWVGWKGKSFPVERSVGPLYVAAPSRGPYGNLWLSRYDVVVC